MKNINTILGRLSGLPSFNRCKLSMPCIHCVQLRIIQRPVPPYQHDGNPQTVETALQLLVPGVALTPTDKTDFHSNASISFSAQWSRRSQVRVRVQGCELSLDTPLEWLCKYCSHPDQFVYVCVVKLGDEDGIEEE